MEIFVAFLVISALVSVAFAVFAISQNGLAKPPADLQKMRSFHAEAYAEYKEHQKHCKFDESTKHCACGRY